jgi:hypothetical protein
MEQVRSYSVVVGDLDRVRRWSPCALALLGHPEQQQVAPSLADCDLHHGALWRMDDLWTWCVIERMLRIKVGGNKGPVF